MKHLMIFAIGPVQDFIATARRSRDLWYGSWMLSELAKAAALSIGSLEPPGELIFPNPQDLNDLLAGSKFTSPNKIVVVVSGDPKTLADSIHSAIKARMNKLWEEKSLIGGKYDEKIAKQQVDDLIEFSWVSVPYDDSDEVRIKTIPQQGLKLPPPSTMRTFTSVVRIKTISQQGLKLFRVSLRRWLLIIRKN